jgi:hypothetical protein
MTEARGAKARWSSAALIAPAAAALFTGVTTWALHHDPSKSAATVDTSATNAAAKDSASKGGAADDDATENETGDATPAASADPELVALRASVAQDRARVHQVERMLAQLRAACGGPSTAPVAPRRAVPVAPAPPKASQRPPAPPPATHGNTGASSGSKH